MSGSSTEDDYDFTPHQTPEKEKPEEPEKPEKPSKTLSLKSKTDSASAKVKSGTNSGATTGSVTAK